MNGKSVNAIGLMSGTSLDGLDIVYVKFAIDDDYRFKILSKETVQYSSDWKLKLQKRKTNSKNLQIV